MPMVPFYTRCPETAETEIRIIKVLEDAHIPAGVYGFIELYCDELGCDCRRVYIHVTTPEMESGKPLATINFGWESKDFYRDWMHGYESEDSIIELKGPSLAPMQVQSDLAPHFLQIFRDMVNDAKYVNRLRRHYYQFREAVEREHTAQRPKKNVRITPNSPCPCGSGRKHKKCCGGVV